jgi:hypothetical protein
MVSGNPLPYSITVIFRYKKKEKRLFSLWWQKFVNFRCVTDKRYSLPATHLSEALLTNCVLKVALFLQRTYGKHWVPIGFYNVAILFAAHLPEALSTSCVKCTDAQKSIIKRASKYLITNRPSDWADINNKYDPERKYHDSFRRFLDEEWSLVILMTTTVRNSD